MKTDIQETGSVEQIKSRVSSNRMLREVIDRDVLGDQSRGNEIIKGVCSDSRRVVPGSAFFCYTRKQNKWGITFGRSTPKRSQSSRF